MGNSPRDYGPGGKWLGFIFIWWGIILMGSCPRTLLAHKDIKRQSGLHLSCGRQKGPSMMTRYARSYSLQNGPSLEDSVEYKNVMNIIYSDFKEQ